MVNDPSHAYELGWYFTETHGSEPKRLMETIVQSLLEKYDINYESIPQLTIDLSQGVSEEQVAAAEAEAEAEAELSAGGRRFARRSKKRLTRRSKKRLTRRSKKQFTRRFKKRAARLTNNRRTNRLSGYK
jgi:hypothetical protein